MRRLTAIFRRQAHRLGFTSALYKRNCAQRVLSYHNILPDGSPLGSIADGLTVTSSRFRMHLECAMEQLTPSTSLGEECTFLVTFDDGNVNNCIYARPILEDLGLRAYFFVTLDGVRRGLTTWPDLMALWCDWAEEGEAMLTPSGAMKALDGEEARRALFLSLLKLGSADAAVRGELIEQIYEWLDRSCVPDFYLKARFAQMRKSNIEDLIRAGHFVGSHSVRHDNLASMNAERLALEMREAALPIGAVFNTDVFCYPFGGSSEVNVDVARACEAAGFRAAFINRPDAWEDWGHFSLPRLTLTQADGPYEVHAKLSGFDALARRFYFPARRILGSGDAAGAQN